MTTPGADDRADSRADSRAERRLTALLTCAMAFSMLQLFLIGALGPRLVGDLGLSPTLLGLTTTIGFGTAAVLSPAGGRIVDRIGPRRSLVALLVVSAAALALIGAAPGAGLLLGAVALGGIPQALANPATNKAVLAAVVPARRGAVTGMKQSGVQLGAFAAGLPLTALAGGLGWRGAVWTAAGVALLTAPWASRALPPDPTAPDPTAPDPTAPDPTAPDPTAPDRTAPESPVRAAVRPGPAAPTTSKARSAPAASAASAAPAAPAVPARAAQVPRGPVVPLAVFSLFLGAGIASVNTYLALFGAQRLGLAPTAAGALVAVLGVTGIVGRVGWAKAARPGRAEWLPGWLATGAVPAALLLAAAVTAAPLVWAGAVAVGVFAVSANAVTMVLVMQRAAPGRAGQDSALVAAGFFAGFAWGPPLFGTLAQGDRYGTGWLLVAAEFAVAGAVAFRWAVRDRRTRREPVA